MKTLCIFIFLLVFSGCSGCSKSDSSGDCKPNYFKDTFENYSVGTFPSQYPWEYKAGSMAKLDVSVVDQGCVVGTKCLKVNMFTVSTDPNYDAEVKAKTGCYDNYPILYSQFYVKYLYADGSLTIGVEASSHFHMYISNATGVEVTGPAGRTKIVDPGVISPGNWYRMEMRMNYSGSAILDIKVYDGNNLTPVVGSTGASGIKILPLDESVGYKAGISYRYYSEYLYMNPNSDLNNFSFFIDDFAISTDPSILKVGF